MLWYKAWLDTRWRFLIGLGLLVCSAVSSVLIYPQVLKMLPMVPPDLGGAIGREVREAAALSQSYAGYVWTQWFRQSLSQFATLFAVLLGTAGLLSQTGGALFTLSLPISRERLLRVRAATGLVELLALTVIPSLFIPLISPAINESYGIGRVLVHSFCFFIAVSLFFMLAFLLSTVFDDPWRPLLITLVIAFAFALLDRIPDLRTMSVYRVMSGESWFRNGELPWEGLLISAAVSAALYYGAVRNLARRDF
jgi:hypothetical protein